MAKGKQQTGGKYLQVISHTASFSNMWIAESYKLGERVKKTKKKKKEKCANNMNKQLTEKETEMIHKNMKRCWNSLRLGEM